MNKEERSSTTLWYLCEVHPKDVVVGVCHLCLNDRLLLILATAPKQPHHNHYRVVSNSNQFIKKPQIKFPINIFCCYSRHDCATPDQDSFISIKFEDNGVAVTPWNKNKTIKFETNTKNSDGGKNVIKPPESGSMRWRKRIGHMVQLIRWKKTSCHNNVRTRNGTKRRTKE